MDVEALITLYCEAWDEPDRVRRRQILARVWAADATYTDPTVHTAGIDELVEHTGKVLEKYPGSRIVRTSAVDTHHTVLRFSWQKKSLADGSKLPEGIELGGDGKLRRMVGFFGALAARQTA